MENFKVALHTLGIITIIIGFVQIYFRVKYMRSFKKNITDNVTSFVFGKIWLPIANREG